MEYKDLIQALNLDQHTDTLERIKDDVDPEVWEELEKHLELKSEVEGCNRYGTMKVK